MLTQLFLILCIPLILLLCVCCLLYISRSNKGPNVNVIVNNVPIDHTYADDDENDEASPFQVDPEGDPADWWKLQ